MNFKVTDKFNVCGHVPKRYTKKLIKAIEAVPQSIEIKELDAHIVANLKPAKLMGVESRGMLLAASLDGAPNLLAPDGEVPPGTGVR